MPTLLFLSRPLTPKDYRQSALSSQVKLNEGPASRRAIIKGTLRNTQTACVYVLSYLSSLSDNFTILVYRHNLIIAGNGRQRWLEAVQRNAGGGEGIVARTESYETVIDW